MSYHGSSIIIEGSLEVKLSTIRTNEKAVVGRVREEEKKENQRREIDRRKKMQVRESRRREEKEKEDQRKERVRRKKMQVREKVEKLRNTAFF